jgi:hypothetical protein
VLDGQAPDVKVIADGDNDIDDEASVHTDSGSEHHEHEGDLVDIATKSAGPAESEVLLEIWADAVNDTEGERDAEDVGVGKSEVDEMGGDHLAYAVGVDNTGKEREGDEMVVEDSGLEPEVGDDEGPDAEEGDETEHGAAGAVAVGAAGADDIAARLVGVEDEDDAALDEVPLGEGEVVDPVGDAHGGGHADDAEHALLPEVGAAHEAGDGEDDDDGDDAFDGAVDDSEGEGLGVVGLPGLDVEGEESYFRVSGMGTRGVIAEFMEIVPAKRVATVFQPCPMFCEAAKIKTSREVLRASTPWSKSSPRGPDCLVRRLQARIN